MKKVVSQTDATKGNATAQPVKIQRTAYLSQLPLFSKLPFEAKDAIVCAIHNHSRGGHPYPTVKNIGGFGALFAARMLKKTAGNGLVSESDRMELAEEIKRQVKQLSKTV